MRHGSTSRRSRNRSGGGKRGSQNRTQVFDSNGPDVRIRGTAHQVCEKYTVLAKDASSTGDLVLTQSYLQHAEHYQRLINSWGESGNDSYGAYEKDKTEENDDLGLPDQILERGGRSVQAEDDVRELAEA